MNIYEQLVIGVMLIVSSTALVADDGMLLNCLRYSGEQEFQIYINESEEYIIYNAQHFDSHERMREFKVTDSNETSIVDIGLDITINTSSFIRASDDSGSFLFIKRDASFAYAWTTPISIGEGMFAAFGNSHEGSCSVNPFNLN